MVNRHWVSRRWLTEGVVKHFKSGVLRNINQKYGKLKKKEFLHRFISKILFIDTQQLSKMQISWQVFFTDFVDRIGTTYLKYRFLWSCYKLDCLQSILRKFCSYITIFYNKNNSLKSTCVHTCIHTYIHTYIYQE